MLVELAIRDIVLEVTDDKSLPKAERKRLQIEHAAHASPKAKLVKLADKIANLRDLVAGPPADWGAERRQEYFECTKTGVRAKFSLIFASRESNVLAAEIVEDLKVALEQFREIAGDLGSGKAKTGAE